jgi:plasmid maintenance system antidote protein VapI
MNTENIQSMLFREIRDKIPQNISLADSVAELLFISQDSAYRRIRGEKPISLDELQKLSSHYDLSVDRLLNLQNKAFTFQGHLMDETNYDIETWLKNLGNITRLIKAKPSHHIYYLAKDVPFIYLLQFPVLAAFKEFFRKRSFLSSSQTRGLKYSVSDINPTFSQTASEIVKMYNTIPSTEIWSSECFNGVIKQIQFYQYTGQIASRDDYNSLFDTLELLVDHLENQAESGKKYNFGEKPGPQASSLNLYNNELFIGEDTILADLGDTKITFLNHSFINYMTTTDESFCGFTLKMLKNMISRSTPVSWAGEKGRKIFFNTLKKKIVQGRTSR